MKEALRRKERREKSEVVKGIIRGLVDETIDIPNNAIVLDPDIIIEIFTRKRMELLKYINKYQPNSIQKLSDLTGRKKQAVDRDLQLLAKHELLSMKKEGRNVIPRVNRKFLIVGLTDIYPIEISRAVNGDVQKPIDAQVYADGVNVNQKLMRW